MMNLQSQRSSFHPLAVVEADEVGEGTRVWAYAHVMKGARVGAHCNLGEGVFVEAGAMIGNHVTVKNGVAVYDPVIVEDEVFLGPHCVLTNDRRPRSGRFKRLQEVFETTVIRRGATIGANATVVCGHEIGEYAMVAAGAVVTRNVKPYTLVAGIPAREIGAVCACGQSLDSELTCPCGRSYRRAEVSGEIQPAAAVL